MSAGPLVDHFFRHEYGRLVATLTRRVGVAHLALAEDAAQTALLRALERWPRGGVPDNPTAWLFHVARNALTDALRTRTRRRTLLVEERARAADGGRSAREGGPASAGLTDAAPFLANELPDDLLRMLFVCCDPEISPDSQLSLALKTLCGFSVREVALRTFASEAAVYKRLARARAKLRQLPTSLDTCHHAAFAPRVGAVRHIVYVLFTEGYLSSDADDALRLELCGEALRLGTLLAAHPLGAQPETYALLALMHLHHARAPARLGPAGALILLEDQDRSRWDAAALAEGLRWLERSAQGDVVTRFHVEAGIAAAHGLAPSFAETPWRAVAESYALLERLAPSWMHRLNRALATAEFAGPAAGLALLSGPDGPAAVRADVRASLPWTAAHADLHRRCGDTVAAERYRRQALAAAPSAAVRALVARRLGAAVP